MKKKPHWYIDTSIIKHNEDASWRLKQAMEHHEHTFTEYKPFSSEQEGVAVNPKRLNLLYGTHGFVNVMRATFKDQVHAYCNDESMKASHYYPFVPPNYLLNEECFFLPFGLLQGKLPWLFETWQNNFIFVRPDSGFKRFVSKVLFKDEWSSDLQKLKDFYRVDKDTLCLVAPAWKLSGEARHVVVGGKVVDSSWYQPYQKRFGGNLESVRQDEERMIALAEKLAAKRVVGGPAYTIDTCLAGGQVKVVEINSFSCAGLYDCDYKKVFDEVTNQALYDYEEYGLI